jgi:hypothetical protein
MSLIIAAVEEKYNVLATVVLCSFFFASIASRFVPQPQV